MRQPESANPSAASAPSATDAPASDRPTVDRDSHAPLGDGDLWLGLPIPPHVWVRIGVLAALFIFVHSDFLIRTARIAWTDGDWSHAMLVPLFSLYFIYQQRDDLADARLRTCWPGLAIMLAGFGGYVAGLVTANDMLKGYSMIAELFGLVLLFVGPAAMRVLWFPIFYLVFAVKVSPNLWEAIAWKMQLFAAHASVFALMLIGIDAQVTSTTIELWHDAERIGVLNVAQACSGMRMLMTFVALGVAVAYLWDRPWWARLTMVAMTIPIAILVNVGRVTILGMLYLIDPAYSTGDFHLFIGMLMLAPALGLFLLIGWLLDMLTEDDDEQDRAPRIRRRERPAPSQRPPGQEPTS